MVITVSGLPVKTDLNIRSKHMKSLIKYHSHIGMLKDELEEFLPLARVWKDNYSYKKYSLSILMGPNDWFYDLKKAKILGLIRGMNIKQ